MKKLVICLLFLASTIFVFSCSTPFRSAYVTGKSGEADTLATKKKPGITDLVFAISTGNESQVQKIVDKGVSVKKNYLFNTLSPMVIAAGTGNPGMVELIIKNGGDVNQADGTGTSPLLEAIRSGNVKVVGLLLKHGADPYREGVLIIKGSENVTNKFGNYGPVKFTPLSYAIKYKRTEIVKCLHLNGGVDFNREIKLINSKPLLVYAIENGAVEIAVYMIENGADPCLTDAGGTNAIMAAISGNYSDLVRKITEQGYPVNDVLKDGSSPLMYACSIRGVNPELVKLLVDKGGDMNYKNKKGQTPFSVACLNCSPDVALYLYEKGADIFIPEDDVESNAMKYHFLADYFLARDDIENAKTNFSHARNYYDLSLSKARRRLFGVQVGDFFADVALMATAAFISSPQVQSAATFSYYTNRYNKIYYPSYTAIYMDMMQFTDNSSEGKKAYYKSLVKDYKSTIQLIDSILDCFGKNLPDKELHSEIDKIVTKNINSKYL